MASFVSDHLPRQGYKEAHIHLDTRSQDERMASNIFFKLLNILAFLSAGHATKCGVSLLPCAYYGSIGGARMGPILGFSLQHGLGYQIIHNLSTLGNKAKKNGVTDMLQIFRKIVHFRNFIKGLQLGMNTK